MTFFWQNPVLVTVGAHKSVPPNLRKPNPRLWVVFGEEGGEIGRVYAISGSEAEYAAVVAHPNAHYIATFQKGKMTKPRRIRPYIRKFSRRKLKQQQKMVESSMQTRRRRGVR